MGKHSRETSDFEDSTDNATKKRHRVSNSDDGNDPTSSSTSESMFYTHTSHKLPEVKSLLERNWIYKWSMPAFGSNIFEWIGTGERESFMKDVIKDVGDADASVIVAAVVAAESGSEPMQISFLDLFNSYRDILYDQKKPVRKGCDEDPIMESYVMHSLNHAFKTQAANCFRDHDQGFPQPKVLILIPFRKTALRLVKKLIHLTPSPYKVNAELMDQFDKEFGSDAFFRDGEKYNFMMGISLTGNIIRLYSDFNSSDIIIASPAGLSKKIKTAKEKKDLNYLSSVEILVVDLGDVKTRLPKPQWLRQLHIKRVMKHLNMSDHHTQLMRPWYDGHAQFYRQTILLCSHPNYDVQSLFRNHCLNYEGKLRLSTTKEAKQACCTLAMVYPPSFKLFNLEENTAFVIDQFCPNVIAMHGAFDIRKSTKQGERFKQEQSESIKFPLPWKKKLHRCMPHLGAKACLTHIKDEIWKHCKKIPCVNMYSYAKFVARLYLKYKFDRLLSFIFRNILEGSVVVTRHSYLRYDWLGIKLSDVISIALTYPPLERVPDSVSFQLIRHGNYVFLYEVHVGVADDGRLTTRSEPRIYFNGEKEEARAMENLGQTVISLDTIILFISNSHGLLE